MAEQITILTLVIGADYRRKLVECLDSKRKYAEKHGYKYIEGDEQYWDRTRPIAWSKLPFWLDNMKNMPDGALIWISDADVLITNYNKRLEDVMLPLLPKGKDLLMTHDACDHVNSGNMLVRNTPWARNFFRRVNERKDAIYHIWWENKAIEDILKENPDDMKMAEFTKNHTAFNAYLRGIPGEPLWEPGMLLVHFAGVYDPVRMKELIDQIHSGKIPRIDFISGKDIPS
jgi:hypothetical protein